MIRNWKYYDGFSDNEELYITKGQYMAGNLIGILLAPIEPLNSIGNIANAKTFPFPVRYRVIKSLFTTEEAAKKEIISAISELQTEGCRAIACAGGAFGLYSSFIKSHTELISFSTPLMMLPFINVSIPEPEKKIVVINDLSLSENRRIMNTIDIPENIAKRCVFTSTIQDTFYDIHNNNVDIGKVRIGSYIWDCQEKCGVVPGNACVPIYTALKCILMIKNAVAKNKTEGFI